MNSVESKEPDKKVLLLLLLLTVSGASCIEEGGHFWDGSRRIFGLI